MRNNFLQIFVLGLIAVTVTPLPAAGAGALEQDLADKAQTALVRGALPRAAVLLRGAWEISHQPDVMTQLGRVHTLLGQFEEAIDDYESVLKMQPSAAVAKNAQAEIKRLRQMPAPLTDVLYVRASAGDEARDAFKRGLALVKRKGQDREKAIRLLRAALVLDPNLPGPYRVLGATYGQMKVRDQEQKFLQDYLRIRPDGKVADEVRKRLAPSGVLVPVALDASFPCAIWINGRPMFIDTPVKELLMPTGNHTISFVNEGLHLIRNVRLRFNKGDAKRQSRFDFGVLTVKLKPWARIVANGRDIGLWDKIGLPAGDYDLSFEAYDASKTKAMRITVAGGQDITVDKW